MKEIIVNILIFILFFNLIMIVFPEGKTQKYCRLIIKLFLFIYIINSVIFNSAISLDDFLNFELSSNQSQEFVREIDFIESEKEFINLINNDLYSGEEVIKNIKLVFTKEMELTVYVYLSQSLNFEQQDNLLLNIADIFNINSENVKITF